MLQIISAFFSGFLITCEEIIFSKLILEQEINSKSKKLILIIFIVSIYFTNSTVNSINAIFTGVISLTFFKVLFIYFVCVLFLVIASIIPLVKILKNNPIDAIRKVF